MYKRKIDNKTEYLIDIEGKIFNITKIQEDELKNTDYFANELEVIVELYKNFKKIAIKSPLLAKYLFTKYKLYYPKIVSWFNNYLLENIIELDNIKIKNIKFSPKAVVEFNNQEIELSFKVKKAKKIEEHKVLLYSDLGIFILDLNTKLIKKIK